jgi:phage terminase large subunit-like protein
VIGWKRKDGKRRFKDGYISTGKKNGKNYWLVGLLLYLMVCEAGPNQELYSYATELQQSGMVYREAAKIIRASPELKEIITPIRTTKTLTFDDFGTFFRSCTAEADSADGINAYAIFYDEIHRAKSRELYDTLKYAGTAIEARTGEPSLLLCTTTAGYDRESIAYEIYSYAKRARDGIIQDDSFYTYIAEAAPEDDWTQEAIWRKANPALGSPIMPLADFKRDFEEARNNPAAENRFKRLRLNCWTEQATRLISLSLWDANGAAPKIAEGSEIFLGVDLSSTQDTTAIVVIAKNELDGYDIIPHIFIPEENLEQQGRKNGVSYAAWAKAGQIHTTPGNAIDYPTITKFILDLAKTYNVREIGFDSWSAARVIPDVEAEGLVCVPIRQGYGLSGGVKEFMRLLLGKKIRHGNAPAMRWQAANVEGKQDKHENLCLEKPTGAASKLRIDSIAACCMAVDRAMRHREPTKASGLILGFSR